MTVTTPTPTQPASGRPALSAPPSAQQVTAVLVGHDGATWLPRVLTSLAGQTRPPDHFVAVDTGSEDGTGVLLRDALGPARVLTAPRSTGFGDAVRQAVARADSMTRRPAAHRGDPWIWLLHDDSAPDPRALELLLAVAARSSSVAVVGPKVVAWDDPDVLLEVGLSVGRGGRRDTGLDGLERDQGQHDHRTDVLAVSSAGMLVRRKVWDELGGFDPALPLLRDDIDLCWRTHLAGHRVVLAPGAVVADAQASVRGLRRVDAIPPDVRRVDRQHGLHVALARASWVGLPFLLGWLVLASVGRSLLMLATESAGRAAGELRALAVVLFLPWRWIGSRWRSRGRRAVPRSSVSPLMTPRSAVLRAAVEVVGGWVGGQGPGVDRLGGRHAVDLSAQGSESGPGADEAQSMPPAPAGWPRRFLGHPMTSVVCLLAAVTGVAWRGTLGGLLTGTLTGGELRGGQASAGELWHAAVDGVRGPGLGTESVGSVAGVGQAGWVWLVALVAGGSASSIALTLALVTAPVLAGCSAYLAGRVATQARWPRAWAALVWGGTPLLGTAVTQGRVGPVVGAVALPMVAALLAKALRGGGSGRLAATCRAALGVALLGSVVPVLGAAAVLVAAVAVLVARGAARGRALLLVVLPIALVGPWVVELASRPVLLLAGPGAVDEVRPAAGSVTVNGVGLTLPGAWRALVPSTDRAAWAAAAGLVAVAVVALASLLRAGRPGRVALALGFGSLLGLGGSAAATMFVLDAQGQPPLTAWAGSGALLALLLMTAAPLFAVDGLPARLARHGFGWRQLVLAPVAALAVLAPLVATAGWAWQGIDGPVTPSRGRGLPAVAAEAATGPSRARTLVLEQDADRLRYRLDGGEPGPVARGLPDPATSSSADQELRAAVLGLVGSGARPGDTSALGRLRPFAVGFVLVSGPGRDGPTAAASPERLAERLDQVTGLARIGRSVDGQLWRVGSGGPQAAPRVRITGPTGRSAQPVPAGPHGSVDTTIGAGGTGRVLALSETASSRWRATLDGRPLATVRLPGSASWQQAFALPADGGRLRAGPDDPTTRIWWRLQLGLAVVLLLLCFPLRRHGGALR